MGVMIPEGHIRFEARQSKPKSGHERKWIAREILRGKRS